MPPLTPKSNYSKRPVRRLRLPKLGTPKSQSLFEEYFYGFLVIIFVVVTILLKAGGMNAYDAIVVGLWVTGFTWFVRQVKGYREHRANPEPVKKPAQAAAKTQPHVANGPLPAGMKPMIGPQWPLKPAAKPSQVSQKPAEPNNKRAFVYERPTLPDRKPKFPANWPGRADKKPKR